jgi:secreted Zn-dependent insulinase-like peptidase
MFSYHIHKKFSLAFDADLNGRLGVRRSGLTLNFIGYSEKMELFIDMYTNELKNISEIVNETTFNQFRTEQKEDFINSLKNNRSFGQEYMSKLLVDKFHLDYDMYKLMDQISYEDVQKILPKVLKKIKFKVLAQGNITKDETLKIVNLLEKNFESESLQEVNFTHCFYK